MPNIMLEFLNNLIDFLIYRHTITTVIRQAFENVVLKLIGKTICNKNCFKNRFYWNNNSFV